MPTLTTGLDLDRAFGEIIIRGAAYLPDAIDEAFREALLSEIAAGPFETAPERKGPKNVQQQMVSFAIRDSMSEYPHVRRLRDELVARVRDHRSVATGLQWWDPNDASVQRYQSGSVGVSPHLDGKRYQYLVAVITVDGAASFALCTDRSGTILREWETQPGDLILMRAPGLAGNEDGRPLHTVAGPQTGSRTSLTYRMDTQATPP